MIIDAMPARVVREHLGPHQRAIAAFLQFIERRLGVAIVVNGRNMPEDPALLAPLRLAHTLHAAGVIKEFGKTASEFADEPRMHGWYAVCENSNDHRVAGMSWDSRPNALYATLAEALERYIWFTQSDYFDSPTVATTAQIARRGYHAAPDAFVGYDEAARNADPKRELRGDAEYLWIRGISLVRNAPVYLPAQVVSPLRTPLMRTRKDEPGIRWATTNGLATATSKTSAQLAGTLELIERDAYMILWLNQLSAPRVPLAPLRARDAVLDRTLASCERYRLNVHVVRMPTDAPTHAIAVIVEDTSGHAPRFAVGLRAQQTLSLAVRKALTEAIRARSGYRTWERGGNTWREDSPVLDIGHRERIYYWGVPEHAAKLEFLIRGEEEPAESRPWEAENDEQHLERILGWCRTTGMDCISVPLTGSKANPTAWHVEMMVMPALQPTYLTEATRAFGGNRLRDIPRLFGYTPLDKPFGDAPHPFS